jgi:nitrite reductase/ring-hydroxylating ferredoxin subunit
MANPARPAAGTKLCAVDEIEDPGSKGFRFVVDEMHFAGFVVRNGEQLIGYVDRCPHQGMPLDIFGRYLTPTGRYILCGVHGGTFKLNGEGIGSPCIGYNLTPWAITVRDGEIFTA